MNHQLPLDKAGFRAGLVSILGRPNVGKSTLLNALAGEKVAIVSAKPQTTRKRVRAIKNLPNAQIVFVDTPGYHRARGALNRFMVEEALTAMGEADLALLVLESWKRTGEKSAPGQYPGANTRELIGKLGETGRPVIAVINKIDLTKDRRLLLPQIDALRRFEALSEIVPVSAAKGLGLPELLDVLLRYLPEGPALFPPDILSDQAERFFAAELIREQLFAATRDEIPYSTAVLIEHWEDAPAEGKLVKIHAIIAVERDNQKGIVIGKGGQRLKEIGTKAREAIERFLDAPVFLELFVKVFAGWTDSQRALRELGYAPDKT